MLDLNLFIQELKTIKHKDELYNIFWQMFSVKHCNNAQNVNVLILCSPCHGFGDVVFAIKLVNYLKQWYKCNLKIATTMPDSFIQIGFPSENLFKLKSKKRIQCRRYKYLNSFTLNNNPIKLLDFDLIFIAPLAADFDPNISDIKYLIPYANKFNTYFFSEYNDDKTKNFDFPTGIGENNMGIFLNEDTLFRNKTNKKLETTKNPYSVVYIAESIERSEKCFMSFLEMVVKKNKIHQKFDIIVPEWIVTFIKNEDKYRKKLLNYIHKYFDLIIITTKTEKFVFTKKESSLQKNTLNIRGEVFPLTNNDMLKLIKYSERDILLTGDQSITDALSCCSNEKNIFYQIASWKENFGKYLTTELPNKYLKSKKTECGSINALKYKSSYKYFNDKWDFRILAREKMDGIFLTIKKKKSDELKNIYDIDDIQDMIIHSNSLCSFLKKFNIWIEEED